MQRMGELSDRYRKIITVQAENHHPYGILNNENSYLHNDNKDHHQHYDSQSFLTIHKWRIKFFDKIDLPNLFRVPDIWSVTRGGSVKAIVDNMLLRPFNLQLIIIRFAPWDWTNRIDDLSVAMWPKSSEFLSLMRSTISIPSCCPPCNTAR